MKNDFYKTMFEVILISEYTDSEIRITSTFWYFCQANRQTEFHFEKPIGGSRWACPHAPKGSRFFRFDIQNFET